MITIKVATLNGKAVAQPIAAEFDETGGSIGRSAENALVLPDPQRQISRTHASVVFAAGCYAIRDQGSVSPVYVNGRPLGNGHETPIKDGDEIRIGPYTLQVILQVSQSMRMPGERTLLRVDAEVDRIEPTFGGDLAEVKDDPLGFFGSGQASPAKSSNPFADLLAPVPARPSAAPQPVPRDTRRAPSSRNEKAPSAAAHTRAAKTPSQNQIFDDPFAERPADQPNEGLAGAYGLPDDFDFAAASNQNVDQLFGLERNADADLLPADSSHAEPFSPSKTRPAADPFSVLDSPWEEAESFGAQRDNTPEIHGSFSPPKAVPDPAMRGAQIPESAEFSEPLPPSRSPLASDSMILSWNNGETENAPADIKTVVVKPSEQRDAGARRGGTAPRMKTEPVDPGRNERTRASNVVPQSPSVKAADAISREELLRAFLSGAGVPDLDIHGGLTPALMNVFGKMLRESTQGTLDLLLARALTKREVRAEMTVIVARENNPLKFAPNVEAALSHLLAPQGRGFLTPLRAMKDAYDDLRAHQFALTAGMRAALAAVLTRFDPSKLEHRLTQKGMIDTLVPMKRRARLWDLFEELYGDISREAEDDFHSLFGKEFLRAYEAQLDKLERDEQSENH
ncbi:MAG: type VI secretion system-associated FHA domain protein TagH [Burkholderiales bacterium]|nr:type VI secretion system-associated FHA domain protein TagH [Burkholderiales bacterium]